ncbi:E3 ubiquitin-protein ligase Topors-like [Battus philenor]|uniref:E3 ubiquitin-protein ligase Topors-like n=1 Tax=Battus philenor TaxID=42288 RepID=UPI0035D05667
METLSAAAQDDSSGANPSSIKSDDSSPQHGSGRGSPPPNCAICLGTCRNKSFTDSCLHQFCFKCLLTWSKVKAECPLCKQNFRSIIHNVRSNHQYEEYMVEQRQTEETTERIDIDSLTTTRRFRYRTTLTLPRRESIAIQQLLLHYPMMTDVLPASRTPPRRRSPASFRRTVYRHNLWARPLPDFTGRYRDCSPFFYRYNDSQMHRLVPWLNRELHYLLNENVGHIAYVISRILELLPQYHINSPEFREAMQRYFSDRTEHFLHELYCFASTPYDLTGYDRNVQYTTDTRISTMVNEVISSSESEASADSDIVMVSSSEPADPPPGPSRVPAPVYPQNYIPEPETNNVIPIETFSQSDTDDDSSEVMVVGYIKPPQDRTPEVVDLLGSDSDVIVQDSVPEQSQSHDSQENRAPVPLVKLMLKKHRTRECDSESEDSTYRPPPPKRKKRHRSNDTATTSDTCRTTPSPARDWDSKSNSSSSQSHCSIRSNPSVSTSSSTHTESSNESHNSNKKKRLRKKNPRRKTKETVPTVSKEKPKRKSSRTQQKEKKAPISNAENEKSKKHKSVSGKGVKSSKKKETNSEVATAEAAVQAAPTLDQPSTSGTSGKKCTQEKSNCRSGRESRRLKSVVRVINSQKTSSDSNSSGNSHFSKDVTTVINSGVPNSSICVSINEEDMGRKTVITSPARSRKVDVLPKYGRSVGHSDDNVTDSEDDLPLNLTVQKKSPCSY